MERIRQKFRDLPFRTAFACVMLAVTAAVLLASALTIAAGFAFRRWLLPETGTLYLSFTLNYADSEEHAFYVAMNPGEDVLRFDFTEDSFDLLHPGEGKSEPVSRLVAGWEGEEAADHEVTAGSISLDRMENNMATLSPKRRLAYQGTFAAMILLPVCYSLAGILFGAFWFYRHKIVPPLTALTAATGKIREQDLDFTVSCDRRDELGGLCLSFEEMRAALLENNRRLWDISEARRKLQASVAHDLRNPIAIIRGYTEYLQIHLEDTVCDRGLLSRTAEGLTQAAVRLERYTDSLRDIQRLEELPLRRTDCELPKLLDEMAEDFQVLAEQKGLLFELSVDCAACHACLDAQVLYRILENIVGNALRFAVSRLTLAFSCRDGCLQITVSDDGEGFPEEILRRQKGIFFLGTGEHMGMGLTVCQILCQKHGGSMSLENAPSGGAVAVIKIPI